MKLSYRDTLQILVKNAQRILSATNAQEAQTMRLNQETTKELKNRLLDPNDELLDVDRNLGNERIDPRHLSFDAGIPQWFPTGLIVTTNYENVTDDIRITSGTITITNNPALVQNRYNIDKRLRNAEPYLPVRTWAIAETLFSLPTSAGYFLYAKLPLTEGETVGTLEVNTEHVEAKRFIRDKFLYYKMGYITEADPIRKAMMLWGNVDYSTSLDARLFSNGVLIYLHTESSDLPNFRKLLLAVPEDAFETFEATGNNGDGEILLKEFTTEPGYPGIISIPSGVWLFESWMAVTSNDRCYLVVRVYRKRVDNAEFEIFNFEQKITAVGAARFFYAAIQNNFFLDETDRIVIKYFFRNDSPITHSMYLFIEGISADTIFHTNVRIPLPVKALGDFVQDIYVVDHPVYPIEYLKFTKNDTEYHVTEIAKPDGLIYFDGSVWVTGLTYAVGNAIYYLGGELYETESTEVTADAADPDYPRIDIIVVDDTELVYIIKGTPGVNPQKPTVNPATQIELTQILIPAGATEPAGVTDELIYDENIEWTAAASGVTVNFDNNSPVFHGAKSANVGVISNNDTISFTNDETIDITEFMTFSFELNLKAAVDNKSWIMISFWNGATMVSNEVKASFNKGTTGTFQVVVMQLTEFTFTQSDIDKVVFRWSRTPDSTHNGFYLDFIKLQTGVIQQEVNTSVTLIGDVSGSGVTGIPISTTLATVNSNVGQFGDATNIPKITVDEKGRITAVENVGVSIPPAINPTSDSNPVDTDEVVILRGTSWLKTTWTVIKVFLKTYFDTVYAAIGHVHTFLQLSDSIGSYTGKGGKVIKVKQDETGLETGDAAAAGIAIIPKNSGSFIFELTDANALMRVNYATAVNATIPPNTDVAFPVGTVLTVEQVGNGTVTGVAGSGVTINAYLGGKTTYGQYYGWQAIQVSINVWTLFAGT